MTRGYGEKPRVWAKWPKAVGGVASAESRCSLSSSPLSFSLLSFSLSRHSTRFLCVSCFMFGVRICELEFVIVLVSCELEFGLEFLI